MAHVHLPPAPASNSRWFAGLGALGIASIGLAFAWQGLQDPAQASAATASAAAPVRAEGSAARAAGATARTGPEVAQPVQAQALLAAQKEAAREVERQPVVRPLAGPVTERPAYVSHMEWLMLKAAASQHDRPEQELTRLVNFLRFNKQLEVWQAMAPQSDAERRRMLAEQLLADLPERLLQGEMSLRDLQQLQGPLIADVVPDQSGRVARAALEAKRLAQAQAHLAQHSPR